MQHWAKKWDCCQECGTTDKPHEGRGLCKSCYRRWRRKTPVGRAASRRQQERARRRKGIKKRGPIICADCGQLASHRGWGMCSTCYNRAKVRQWKKASPGKKRAQNRRRDALKRGATTVGRVDERKIYNFYKNTCVYCPATEDLTLDHVVPLARGGVHSEENLVVACRPCNSSKGVTPLSEWLKSKEASDGNRPGLLDS